MPLRLLIVDDNDAVRRGIRAVLSDREDWCVCGEARDGIEATELARKLQPDVVLMDMSMPRMGGAEATKIIRREVPTADVIVVTQNEGSVVVRQLAEIGARAYVSKTTVTRDLIPAILEVTGDVEKKECKSAETPAHASATPAIANKTEAGEVLAEAEDRLRRAMETAELGLWNWYPGQDLATWENQKMYEIFGRSPNDGPISSADFLEKFVHPGDAAGYQNAMKDALEKGKSFFFQGRFFRADGELRWGEFRGRSEFRADGSVARMMGTARDITDYKQAEETVRLQRERHDLVAEATQVGFWFCDLPFDKLNWDQRVKEHFWLPADAAVTIQTFYERLHPEDRERTREAIAYSNHNDTPYDIEYRTISPDGRVKWIRAIGRTFYDATHKPIRFDGVTLDITEKKRAEGNYQKLAESLEAEVQERTEELEQLSRSLMHAQDEERRRVARELHDSAGQTLTVLGMNLGILAQKAQRVAPDLANISSESQRLVQQLHEEIRTASYLLYPPLLEESGLVSSLSHYAQGLQERSGMKIQLDIAEELGRLPPDIELVAFRLVQECLTNIHRHSGSKSACIRIKRDGDHVGIEVRDQGRGIASEKIGAIQAGRSGVGIRGMRDRLRQFNGTLDIQSDGAGTRILAKIPAEKLPA